MEAEKLKDKDIPDGMSKNQWKKLLKQQRIEQGRAEWKRKQKEKDREKKRRKKEEGQPRAPPAKRQKMSAPTASPVRVAIELGYQDLMTDMDIQSLMKQCQRCYAANRRAESPLQLYFTSFGGRCKQRMEQAVQGYTSWDVHFKEGDYVEEFGSENIVYLVAESPNVLTDLAPEKVYVIGGLVDHNHHKGYCYQSALSKGVAHAQLPISEYITLNSRKVLTVNHVFEILVAFVQNRDWKMAFYQVIPQRKQVAESIQASDSVTESIQVSNSVTESIQVSNSPTTTHMHESPSTASCACNPPSVPLEPDSSEETQTTSSSRQVCTTSENVSSSITEIDS